MSNQQNDKRFVNYLLSISPALKNAGFLGARQKTIWQKNMNQLDNKSTFKGEEFNPLSIPGKKQEGLYPNRRLYINSDQSKIVVVGEGNDVLITISTADGSALMIENL